MTVHSFCPPLVLAVSSRALFDQREGVEDPGRGSAAGAGTVMRPGSVFTLVRKLLALNTGGLRRVEVVLVSPESAAAGLPVLQALAYHRLPITRAAFTRGAPGHRYAAAFGAQLFLSTDAREVRLVLAQGIAAAIVTEGAASESDDAVVRIAFDGDAVLFSDEAEQIYAQAGLDAFVRSEQAARHLPLGDGPFRLFFLHLHRLQMLLERDARPIRTALVTARSVAAHERALRTLASWRVEVDEAIFLGGLHKGPTLRSFGADIFFDDQKRNCELAAVYVPCAHVPYGIKNGAARPALQLNA